MNDLTQLRANFMGGMNSYLLGEGDEMILDYWFRNGLPDEVSEEMLMEIAEDNEAWLTVISAFDKCCRSLGVY